MITFNFSLSRNKVGADNDFTLHGRLVVYNLLSFTAWEEELKLKTHFKVCGHVGPSLV